MLFDRDLTHDDGVAHRATDRITRTVDALTAAGFVAMLVNVITAGVEAIEVILIVMVRSNANSVPNDNSGNLRGNEIEGYDFGVAVRARSQNTRSFCYDSNVAISKTPMNRYDSNVAVLASNERIRPRNIADRARLRWHAVSIYPCHDERENDAGKQRSKNGAKRDRCSVEIAETGTNCRYQGNALGSSRGVA